MLLKYNSIFSRKVVLTDKINNGIWEHKKSTFKVHYMDSSIVLLIKKISKFVGVKTTYAMH